MSPAKSNFPKGPGFFQERYLAAYDGLSRILAHSDNIAPTTRERLMREWREMHNNLIGEDHTREGDDE